MEFERDVLGHSCSPPVQKPLRSANGWHPIFSSSERLFLLCSRVPGKSRCTEQGRVLAQPSGRNNNINFQSSGHLALHKEDALDLHRAVTLST